ncbi:hypothetical protein TSMEX_010020 [Taenia solium]|eukprot:TsM_000215700 transcript=TsM_000215700 gene=TsM_000215700
MVASLSINPVQVFPPPSNVMCLCFTELAMNAPVSCAILVVKGLHLKHKIIKL